MKELVSFVGIIAIFLLLLEVKYKYVSKNKKEVIMLSLLGGLGFLVFFEHIIFDGLQLSFTNFMYAKLPFSYAEIQWGGWWLSDPIDQFLPFIYEIFTERNILLWSSETMFGMPVIIANFLLNPSNIGYVLGLEYGQAFQFIVKYSSAFVGMYLFLKNLKFDKYAAYAGAITYTFSSVLVVWGGWPHSDVAALAPFLFYAIDRLIMIYKTKSKENKVKYYLLFIVMLYIMLIVGMPTYVAYFMCFGIIYTIFRLVTMFSIKKNARVMGFFFITVGIAIIVAVLLSSPYIVELYTQVSDYADSRTMQSFSALEWNYIRGFLFPYGGNGSYQLNECTIYGGLLFVFFFVLTPVYYKRITEEHRREVIFWSLSFVAVMCFIFTEWTGYIYQYIPLVNSSNKIRIIVLLNFICAVLSAWVVRYLREYKESKLSAVALVIPLLICGCMWGYISEKDQFAVICVMILLALLISVYAFLQKKWIRKVLILALLVTITFDMAGFAKDYLPYIAGGVPAIPEGTDSVTYLQEETEDGTRVLTVGSWTFFAATNMFYDIDTIVGHGFINTNDDMGEYLTTIDASIYSTATRTEVSSIENIENQALLSYASVGYLYYSYDGESEDSLEDNAIVIDNMVIEELQEYSARAFVATDIMATESLEESLELMSEEYLANTAFVTTDIYEKYDFDMEIEENVEINQVLSYEDMDDEVHITVETTGNNMLVLTDYYYDGWSAYIDGEEVDIEKVNYLFRGVYLEEAGTYEIVFKYLPTSVVVEWEIYAVMVVVMILIAIFRKRINELLSKQYERIHAITQKEWHPSRMNILLALGVSLAISGLYLGVIVANTEWSTEHISLYTEYLEEEVNISRDGTSYVTTTSDPQLIFSSVGESIQSVIISFEEPLEQGVDIVIYYALEGEFSEEQCVSVYLQEGEEYIEIPLECLSEECIRIDIGGQDNLYYSIEDIEVVVGRDSNVIGISLILFLVFFVLFDKIDMESKIMEKKEKK